MSARPPTSAGILLWRRGAAGIEVLLIHPGGPFWRNRDQGAWQIPKGAMEPGEAALAAALREFAEETGVALHGVPRPLATIRQKAGKQVIAFALEGDCDATAIHSNVFEIEWPPRSGQIRCFPEVDRADWYPIAAAYAAMLASQHPLLDALAAMLATRPEAES
jgi:predicted NUDIX family NTP pyrophosphohydrolase